MNSEMLSYIKKDSPIHKLTGATKLIVFLLWAVAAMVTYDTRLLVGMLIIGLLSFKISKIEFKEISFVLYFILIFLLLNAIMIFVFSPEEGVQIYGSRTVLFHLVGSYKIELNFETIKMEIASNPQYVSIVRLTTSGIANKVGFCLDDIEDMKVAVSEACTNAIKHSSDNKFSVEYTIFEDGLTIKIVDSGKGYDVDAVDKPNLKEPKESGLGLFIIQSLMDEVDIKSDIDNGTIIKMTKYLGVDN